MCASFEQTDPSDTSAKMLFCKILILAGFAALANAMPFATGTEAVEKRGVIAPRASSAPCTYSCPSRDRRQILNVDQETSAGVLTC